jgi:hypothetical protein
MQQDEIQIGVGGSILDPDKSLIVMETKLWFNDLIKNI